MAEKKHKKIVILGTGGTIAGRASRADDHVGYTAGQVGVAELVATAPGLEGSALELEQIAQVDSKDMEFSVWAHLAERASFWLAQGDVQGLVITHGTDTLEETAYFLHRVLDTSKPVVLTCAMRPASAMSPDGPQNLLDAVAVARSEDACGVVVVCAGTLHSAVDVQKAHTYRLDAFASGDAGPVGYVEASAVRMVRNWPPVPVGQAKAAIKKIAGKDVPQVEIVMSHAGATGRMVDALVGVGVSGIVVACTGNGTVHRALEAALWRARDAGVQLVRATRCSQGQILPGPADAIPHAGGLSPVKARVEMLLQLLG